MLDERRRHLMIDSFISTNGEDTAMALADSLFSLEHATKDDLRDLRAELKGDISDLRAEVKDDFRAFRAELVAVEERLTSHLDEELEEQLAPVWATMATKVDLERALRGQLIWFGGIVGVIVSIATTIAVRFS